VTVVEALAVAEVAWLVYQRSVDVEPVSGFGVTDHVVPSSTQYAVGVVEREAL